MLSLGGGSRLDTVVLGVAKLNAADESDDTSDECYAIGNLHGVGCAGGSDARAVVVGSAVPIRRSSTRTCVQMKMRREQARKLAAKSSFFKTTQRNIHYSDALLTTRKLPNFKTNTCCVACTFYQRKVEGRSIARIRYGE